MTCIGHDESIPEGTTDAWSGAHTCGFGPLDGNYAPFTVAAGPRQQACNHRLLTYL